MNSQEPRDAPIAPKCLKNETLSTEASYQHVICTPMTCGVSSVSISYCFPLPVLPQVLLLPPHRLHPVAVHTLSGSLCLSPSPLWCIRYALGRVFPYAQVSPVSHQPSSLVFRLRPLLGVPPVSGRPQRRPGLHNRKWSISTDLSAPAGDEKWFLLLLLLLLLL